MSYFKLWLVLAFIFARTLANAATSVIDCTFAASTTPFSVTLSSTAWTLVPTTNATGGRHFISLVNKVSNTGTQYGHVGTASTTSVSTTTYSLLLGPGQMAPVGLSTQSYLFLLSTAGAEVVTGQEFICAQ